MPPPSMRDSVAYNLTLLAFGATYAASMPPVEIAGLQPNNEVSCRAPLTKIARGRSQTALLTSGEQRAQVASFNGALQNTPDRVQRCSRFYQERNILHCRAQLTFKCM